MFQFFLYNAEVQVVLFLSKNQHCTYFKLLVIKKNDNVNKTKTDIH